MNPLYTFFNAPHYVVHGDCIEVMLSMPKGSVDLIITSPPYPGQKGDTRTVEEWLVWFRDVLCAMRHILKPHGVLCLNVMFKRTDKLCFDIRLYTEVPRLLDEYGFNMIDVATMGKLNPAPNGSMSRSDISATEPIFICTPDPDMKSYYYAKFRKPYSKKSLTANGGRVYSGNRGRNIQPHKDGAQQSNLFLVSTSGESSRPRAEGQSYPIEIPHRLIQQYSRPGETVFDPFVGAGTTLRAAQELGRLGYGSEIKGEEVKKAMEWLTEPYHLYLPTMEI